MRMLKKELSFVDANGRRARITVEITKRNGYPEFTSSGSYLGSSGQCLDKVSPANKDQKDLIELWKKYHLRNVSKMHNFPEHLEGIIARIEYHEESRKPAKSTQEETDERILGIMYEEGIDEEMLDAVKAYMELTGSDELKDFEEQFAGRFSSDEDFARDMAENIGAMPAPQKMNWPYHCIDWDHAASELMQDYGEVGGFYFRNL